MHIYIYMYAIPVIFMYMYVYEAVRPETRQQHLKHPVAMTYVLVLSFRGFGT